MHLVANSQQLVTTHTEGKFPHLAVLILCQEISEVWLRTTVSTLYLIMISFSLRTHEVYDIKRCQNVVCEYGF
jgi:hypothetical protein